MSATINDLASFNKFFTENQHRFIRFAWTYTRDEVVAEDIVMESLMAYWENRDHMTPEINPAAYVLTVVKINVSIICAIYSWLMTFLTVSPHILSGSCPIVLPHWMPVNPMHCLPVKCRILSIVLFPVYLLLPPEFFF